MRYIGRSEEKFLAGEFQAQGLTTAEIRNKNVEKLFRVLFNNCPVGIYIIRDGKFQFVNPQFQRITGYSRDELLGLKNPMRLIHPKDKNMVREMAAGMLRGESLPPYEYRFISKQGEIKWAMEAVASIQNDSKRLFLGTFMEVTGLKQVEKELQDREEHFVIMAENMLDMISRANADGILQYASPSHRNILGYDPDDILGLSVFEFVHPDDKNRVTAAFQTAIDNNAPGKIDYRCRHADGHYLWLETMGNLLFDGDHGPVTGVIFCSRDISERKRTEGALRESEERYRRLIEHSRDAVFVITPEARCIEANPAACGMTGYDRDQLLKMGITDLLCGENLEAGLHMFNQLVRQGTLFGEIRLRDKGGGSIPAEVNATVLPDGNYLGTVRSLSERKRAEESLRLSEKRFYKIFNSSPNIMCIIGYTNMCRDGLFIDVNRSFSNITGYSRDEVLGRSACLLNLWSSPRDMDVIREMILRQEEISNLEINFLTKSGEERVGLLSAEKISFGGEPCILVNLNDITQRMQFEREVYRLEQLKLVGQMAAGIGHEIRNPMTTVRGFLQMLMAKKEYAKEKQYFTLMIEELDRANSIITEFLSVTNNRTKDLERHDLNLIIKAITPLAAADAMNVGIDVVTDLTEIPELLLNEKEMRQLILNLIRNGLEAMENGRLLTIRTFFDGQEVVLSVQDQGKGIEQKLHKKMGTPFFTTKENGTGLGLAVCYGIAARHSARIDFETGKGGTTFFVRFQPPHEPPGSGNQPG